MEKSCIWNFKSAELQGLPTSWKEFCETSPIKNRECYLTSASNTFRCERRERHYVNDANVLPDAANAEAVLALIKLIQLRNCYNGDWVPDYKTADIKFTIEFDNNRIVKNTTARWPCILVFKSKDLCDMFLLHFRDLIEKLKPLYCIK